jgi:hypothetical protein
VKSEGTDASEEAWPREKSAQDLNPLTPVVSMQGVEDENPAAARA